MSSLGRKISQINKTGKNKSKYFVESKFPIGIATPLEKGYRDNETLFKMHFDPLSQIKDNIKNLLMTQKGQRLGFPDFGTDMLSIYSNTNLELSNVEEIVMQDIQQAISKYMPSITLKNFYSSILDNDSDKKSLMINKTINAMENINISNSNASEFSNKSILDEKIYKIKIEYNVPLLTETSQHIVLFIKSAKTLN